MTRQIYQEITGVKPHRCPRKYKNRYKCRVCAAIIFIKELQDYAVRLRRTLDERLENAQTETT